MNLTNKKLIAFDLDNTLTISKSPLSNDMADLLNSLMQKYFVLIISGGDFPQFEEHVIPYLKDFKELDNLFLMPNSGTKFYNFINSVQNKIHVEDLSTECALRITNALEEMVKLYNLDDLPAWGNRIENRGTQITISVLGQKAPVDEKKKWDPNNEKKVTLKNTLDKMLNNEFQVSIDGSTSLNITRIGCDKAYGMNKCLDYMKLKIDEVLFIADSLYPGGNDFAIKQMGVDSIKTNGPEETLEIIKNILKIKNE